MIIKEIKDYSNRMRINIVSSDGFNPGDEVVLLTKSEYENLKAELFNRENKISYLEQENKIVTQRSDAIMESIEKSKKDMDTELDKLLKISLKHINETNDKQLADKDRQIEQLTGKLDSIRTAFDIFITNINALKWHHYIRGKHAEVITDFISSIKIKNDDQTLDADVNQLEDKNNGSDGDG